MCEEDENEPAASGFGLWHKPAGVRVCACLYCAGDLIKPKQTAVSEAKKFQLPDAHTLLSAFSYS